MKAAPASGRGKGDLVSRVRLTINLKLLVVLAAVLQPLVVVNTGC